MAGIQGLPQRTVSVPFNLGIDTSNNPVLVDSQRLTLINNGRFVKGSKGQLQSRNGHSALTSAVIGGGFLGAGQNLANLNDELDVICTTSASFSGLLAYMPSQSAWQPRAALVANVPSRSPVVRNNYSQTYPDSATASGVTVTAWSDTRGGVWFKVIDQVSGAILKADTQLDAAGIFPQVVANPTGGHISILWTATGSSSIQCAQIATATATVAPVVSTVINSCFAASFFQLAYLSSVSLYGIVYQDSSGYAHVSTLNASTMAVVTAGRNLRSIVVLTVACCVAPNGNFAIASQLTGSGSQTCHVDFVNPSTLANVQNYSQSIPSMDAMTMAPSQTTSTSVLVYGNVLAGIGGAGNYISQSLWDQTTGFGAQTSMINGCCLVSQPFAQGDTNYVLVAYLSTVQCTYFLLGTDPAAVNFGTVVGRYVSQNAVSQQVVPSFTHATPIASNAATVGLAVAVQTTFESSGGKAVSVTGVDQLILDFTQLTYKTLQLGQDLTISGGLPQLYDGQAVTEDGFNVFPEAPICTLLTSQIGITNIVQGSATTPQTFTITFPINQNGSGRDGSLIIPGEYIIFWSSGAPICLWYSVDGNGSAPSFGFSITEVPISAADPAYLIANKTSAVVKATYSVPTFNVDINQILVGSANGLFATPQTFNQFGMAFVTLPTASVHGERYVSMMAGNLIQPGQWFSFTCPDPSGNPDTVYVWFQVNGVGSDPAPISNVSGVEVQVLTSDSAAGVAAKVAAAVGGNVTCGVVDSPSPYVFITDNHLAGSAILVNTSLNPGTIGNGLGVVGPGVATNQWGAVSYCAMFEAVDANGQLARSAPSVPTEVQFPDYGLANAQVSVTFQPLYLTSRPSVDVAIYRTLDTGLLLYRASSETALIYNNSQSLTQTFQDSVPDAQLQFNELMYSQPLVPNSVIPNNCPPAFTQSATFQDQLWINDCEDTQLWWFSKSYTSGVQVEFSNEQTWRFDPIAGPTVGALAMDSNLIVFGSKGIWAVNGAGPDSTGAGQSFVVTQIAAGVGLRDVGSLQLTPLGILFMSNKGIQLLTRGLQIAQRSDGTNWGSPVQAYNATTIVSAQIIPDATEVRFLCASGQSLTYDYQYDQWGLSTILGVDSIVYQGNFYYLTSLGVVLDETDGLYSDGGTAFTWGITSAWFKPAALQGFGGLRRLYLQGYFPAGVGVQMQIRYNYLNAVIDTPQFTPSSDQSQFQIFPSVRKCESFQAQIIDFGSLSSSKKYTLNALDMVLQVKKGGYKGLGPPNTSTP